MAALRDLAEFYDPDLYLPINGRTYRVKCPGISEADRLSRLVLDPAVDAEQEADEIRKILGPVRDEMAANGVPSAMAVHAGRTAILHFGMSPALGRTHWQLGHLGDSANLQAILDAAAPADG